MCYSIQGICKGTNLLECAIVYKVFVKDKFTRMCYSIQGILQVGLLYV